MIDENRLINNLLHPYNEDSTCQIADFIFSTSRLLLKTSNLRNVEKFQQLKRERARKSHNQTRIFLSLMLYQQWKCCAKITKKYRLKNILHVYLASAVLGVHMYVNY